MLVGGRNLQPKLKSGYSLGHEGRSALLVPRSWECLRFGTRAGGSLEQRENRGTNEWAGTQGQYAAEATREERPYRVATREVALNQRLHFACCHETTARRSESVAPNRRTLMLVRSPGCAFEQRFLARGVSGVDPPRERRPSPAEPFGLQTPYKQRRPKSLALTPSARLCFQGTPST